MKRGSFLKFISISIYSLHLSNCLQQKKWTFLWQTHDYDTHCTCNVPLSNDILLIFHDSLTWMKGQFWSDSRFPFPTNSILGWGRWSYFFEVFVHPKVLFQKDLCHVVHISIINLVKKIHSSFPGIVGRGIFLATFFWSNLLRKGVIFHCDSAMVGGRLVDFVVHLPRAKGIVYLDRNILKQN